MKKVLLIDSSSREKIQVGLQVGEKTTYVRSKAKTTKAQAVLPLIDKLLKKHGLKIININAIEINTGPGSFTGLRVSIAIANALAKILKIPINDNKIGEPVFPVYESLTKT